MSDSLEHLLDFTLDVRERRRRQHEAELGLRERAIRDSHAELERRRTKFSTEVRCLIQKGSRAGEPPSGDKAGEMRVPRNVRIFNRTLVSGCSDLQSDCLPVAGAWSRSWRNAHC